MDLCGCGCPATVSPNRVERRLQVVDYRHHDVKANHVHDPSRMLLPGGATTSTSHAPQLAGCVRPRTRSLRSLTSQTKIVSGYNPTRCSIHLHRSGRVLHARPARPLGRARLEPSPARRAHRAYRSRYLAGRRPLNPPSITRPDPPEPDGSRHGYADTNQRDRPVGHSSLGRASLEAVKATIILGGRGRQE